jgi:aryl-alcohol dehydrogenase-like predicted oxidoreductase
MQHTKLSSSLTISKVVTGLWQIADMERQGRLELNPLAEAMTAYVNAGLTSFDMADHYGSAEDVAGLYRKHYGSSNVQMMTKWVPQPGAITKDDVRTALETSLKRLQTNSSFYNFTPGATLTRPGSTRSFICRNLKKKVSLQTWA